MLLYFLYLLKFIINDLYNSSVNKISELKEINKDYGVEVDVRINNKTLYLHEPMIILKIS